MTFQPGKSGNPCGRPKGIVDRRVRLREKLEDHADEIIDVLVARAKGGDSGALKLCVERLIPRVRQDDSIEFEMPEGRLDSGVNMLKFMQELILSVVTGRLSMSDASSLSSFITNQRRQIQNAEDKIKEEQEREGRRKRWEAANSE